MQNQRAYHTWSWRFHRSLFLRLDLLPDPWLSELCRRRRWLRLRLRLFLRLDRFRLLDRLLRRFRLPESLLSLLLALRRRCLRLFSFRSRDRLRCLPRFRLSLRLRLRELLLCRSRFFAFLSLERLRLRLFLLGDFRDELRLEPDFRVSSCLLELLEPFLPELLDSCFAASLSLRDVLSLLSDSLSSGVLLLASSNLSAAATSTFSSAFLSDSSGLEAPGEESCSKSPVELLSAKNTTGMAT